MKLIGILLLAATSALAQPKPVEVNVQQVNDRRAKGFFSELAITLELPKVKSSEVAASRVIVRAATDDTGVDLLDPAKPEPELEPNLRAQMLPPGAEDGPASVSLSLKNPARAATKVKEVRGEIELFMPARDPNSVAEIARFTTMAGKPLAHKAFKANGVEITILTPAQVETEKKRLADAKRKSAKESGWDGEDLETLVADFLSSILSLTPGTDLAVRLKDPNQRIQSVEYLNPAGEAQRVNIREEEGVTIFTSWGGEPKEDWRLRVRMKTPKNIVRHAFALKDVTLP